MNNHYNIVLANAPMRIGNKGCVALSISSIYIIDKILSEKGLSYTLYLPDSMHHDGKEYVLNILGKEIHYFDTEYPVGITIKETIKLKALELKNRRSYSKIFKSADYILDIGQGDSFADIYGKHRFDKIDRIHVLARRYNKPYCILPQTIGPFADKDVKRKAIVSIEHALLCMARDKISFNYVEANAHKQKNINEYIDVAFLLPYDKITHDNNYMHVGLNVSSLLWHGGYTQDNQFGLKDDYKDVIRQIIRFFISKPNVKVHLVPHVVHDVIKVENDYAVSYDLWKEFNDKNLVLSPFFFSPIEAKSYIAGLDFFMGARMHSTIGAFSSGVPVVPMAYSRKFNGLFEDTLDYHFMTDLKAQTKEEVITTIKDAFDKRKELKEIINNRMNSIVKEREQLMYDDLCKFFKIC